MEEASRLVLPDEPHAPLTARFDHLDTLTVKLGTTKLTMIADSIP